MKKLINYFIQKSILSFSVFIFFILCVLAFQGFDVCDEGWYLSFYQQFYTNPETVEYNFVFWLTGVIGGLLYEIYPSGGILSFRILGALTLIFCITISTKILKDYVKNWQLLTGLSMVIFVNNFGYLAFYYNQLSGLLALISILFLAKGITNKNLLLVFISGFVVALNIFTRLPNITLLIFVLLFPFQKLLDNSFSYNYILKQLIFFLFGFITCFLVVFIALEILNQTDIFINAISGIINKGKNTDSNHNILRLVQVYKSNFLKILKIGIKFSILSLLLLYIKKLFSNKFVNVVVVLIGIIGFYYVINNENTIYLLYFLGTIGCLGTLISKNDSYNLKIIALLALLMLYFLPLGSDGGIGNAGYVCAWLSVPLFFNYIEKQNASFQFKKNNIKLFQYKFCHKETNFILILFSIIYFGSKSYNILNEAYFDKGNRFKKTFIIDNSFAANIYTTKKRSEIINPVLNELKKFLQKGDYLLAYDNIPMINYLTETKPYMGISWVWVYDSKTFENKLKKAETTIPKLPVVVQQKFRTIAYFSEPVVDYLNENKTEDYIYKKGRVIAMNNFLKRNNYKIVWSNPYFNIYKSYK